MTVLTVTISNPSPAFESKASEVSFLVGVLRTLEQEIDRSRGTVTSGTIVGLSASGTPNTSLGSWTYTPAATRP